MPPKEITLKSRTKIPSSAPMRFEFRIVDWNTSNVDYSLDYDGRVVRQILSTVRNTNANVITLQEVREHTFILLKKALKKKDGNWRCFLHLFGYSGLVTCVLGTNAEWINCEKLSGIRLGPCVDWWGFLQIKYHDTLITNVHTRAHWKDDHLKELHEKISTGIIAGDFNHIEPGWNQTEKEFLPTRKGEKIDHILTVKKIQNVSGRVHPYYESDHRMISARIDFPIIPKSKKKLTIKKKTSSKWKIAKKLTKKTK